MSSTSSSWRSSLEPHSAHSAGAVSATVMWPSGQYQTGIRCPHQIWREMHHGRTFSSQSRQTREKRSGVKRTRPSLTAAIAGAASSSIAHHHWSMISGSTRVWQRWQVPIEWRYGSLRSSCPRSSTHASTRAPASSCVRPARSPASSFIRPSGPITASSGSSWSRPISKSVGSCPGVTLSAPVPNSGSTRSSAITGTRRSTYGTTTSLPTRSR